MSAPTTVADAQRDDPDLTPADLISAYEMGVEELRLAAWCRDGHGHPRKDVDQRLAQEARQIFVGR